MRGKARVRVFNLYLYEAETEAGKINTKRSNDSLVLKKERHADSLHGVTFFSDGVSVLRADNLHCLSSYSEQVDSRHG